MAKKAATKSPRSTRTLRQNETGAHIGRWIRNETRYAIYARDACTCQYCGKQMELGSPELQLDHVVARARGGSNAATNVVTSCSDCNEHKGDKTLALAFNKATVQRVEKSARALTKEERTIGKAIDAARKVSVNARRAITLAGVPF